MDGMMEPLWQYIIIGVAIAVAAAYLAVHFIRRRRKKNSCADCLERIDKLHRD